MRKALIVGIDNYPSKPLHGCVNDARTIGAIFESNGDGESNFDVKLLTAPIPDAAAGPSADSSNEESPKEGVTRVKLRTEIQALFADDPDVGLFYFSGHGVITSVGGFVVTSDFTSYDEGVSMDEILAYAN